MSTKKMCNTIVAGTDANVPPTLIAKKSTASAGNGLSSLFKAGGSEQTGRFFRAVIEGANASQKLVVEKAKEKSTSVA